MPSMVPTNAIYLLREQPQARGQPPAFKRISPKIGEPFDFTDEEVDDIRAANPLGLREPVNEGDPKENDVIDQAVREAHEAAAQAGPNTGALDDAAVTARTGAIQRAANAPQVQPISAGNASAPPKEAKGRSVAPSPPPKKPEDEDDL